ncbi:MAG: hypothetical protein ACKVOH_06770 [Chlamydiales bacterium]
MSSRSLHPISTCIKHIPIDWLACGAGVILTALLVAGVVTQNAALFRSSCYTAYGLSGAYVVVSFLQAAENTTYSLSADESKRNKLILLGRIAAAIGLLVVPLLSHYRIFVKIGLRGSILLPLTLVAISGFAAHSLSSYQLRKQSYV